MEDARHRFSEASRELMAATERLADGLARFRGMNTEALADLDRGMAVSESFARRDSARWSRELAALLDDFETCRRGMRHAAAVVLLEEGRSVKDIGRLFGVSHQLASRFAGEARVRGSGPDPAG
jgi:hypothetical protein